MTIVFLYFLGLPWGKGEVRQNKFLSFAQKEMQGSKKAMKETASTDRKPNTEKIPQCKNAP